MTTLAKLHQLGKLLYRLIEGGYPEDKARETIRQTYQLSKLDIDKVVELAIKQEDKFNNG